jgi:uncharacterized protein (DUF2062 family)
MSKLFPVIVCTVVWAVVSILIGYPLAGLGANSVSLPWVSASACAVGLFLAWIPFLPFLSDSED